MQQYKKIWIIALSIAILLLFPRISVQAVDLPIDIDVIGGQDEESVDAITTRHRVDLFSERSGQVNEVLAEQIQNLRDSIQADLFEDQQVEYVTDINVQIVRAASDADLFSQPVRVVEGGQTEADSSISIWLIMPLALGCVVLGVFLAKKVAVRKKEHEINVYNHND